MYYTVRDFGIYILNIIGVKRPPAILCSDDSGGIDIDEYEISKAEPLHDFKNIINKVMRELVYATEDSNLKQIISKILLTLKGNQIVLYKYNMYIHHQIV